MKQSQECFFSKMQTARPKSRLAHVEAALSYWILAEISPYTSETSKTSHCLQITLHIEF